MRTSDPKNITQQDLVAFREISRCGFVRIERDGGCLETGWHVSPGRLARLRGLGLVAPSGDSMFGVESQTWKLTDGAKIEEVRVGPLVRSEKDKRRSEV